MDEHWLKVLDISPAEIDRLMILPGARYLGRRIAIEGWYYTHRGADLRGLGVQFRLRRLKQEADVSIELAVKGPPETNDGEETRSSWRQQYAGHNLATAGTLLEAFGFVVHTRRQKIRDTLAANPIEIQIDSYPGIPTYAELTGPLVQVTSILETILRVPSERVTRLTASGVFAHYGVADSRLVLFTAESDETKLFR
ncbi:MAG: hypothetical protein A3J59_01470 [Candidatus Buchananbacteria bacterium RIFCSPHIGHO2_02_FULL_56_16]|uniref:CYTH domain-containing protein n=1 Tax=Candidatus Buchananbacteria bacterium RIFCSPHIGHO2_02_FULL_56_16 TaxID=1797542 RepID=A0A1G1YFY9_9BACT|nr:MAG: hypothetical protein A3J59_01470 [Candidatus Buchananbacteria bacterium RIFCSPHIGHO2_02_FULL_56_16]